MLRCARRNVSGFVDRPICAGIVTDACAELDTYVCSTTIRVAANSLHADTQLCGYTDRCLPSLVCVQDTVQLWSHDGALHTATASWSLACFMIRCSCTVVTSTCGSQRLRSFRPASSELEVHDWSAGSSLAKAAKLYMHLQQCIAE